MYYRICRALSFCLFTACIPFSSIHAAMVTPGQFSVSESGAATYAIPIQAPPGTAGMEPKLALTYSSQAGNGLLGMGWSLSGLSAITRCPRTMAQDNFRGEVNYDMNDRFCLDGQRLITISGSDGANGAEYRTERDSFVKVVSYGSAGNGPAWFKVWTKSGQVMEYGYTADSRIEAQGKTTVRAWALNKVQDIKGNYLAITYTEDSVNGDYYPQKIDYAGNVSTSTPTNNSILFEYVMTRPDVELRYHAGSLMKSQARLSKIQTKVAGGLTKEYRLYFDEEMATKRSRLTSVAECDVSNVCLPGIAFGYAPNANPTFGTAIQSGVLDWGYDAGRAWVDMNGDGRADYCRVVGSVNGQSSNVACTLSTGAGFGQTIMSPVIDWGYDTGREWTDVNGDGKADYCRRVGFANNQSVACTLSTGVGFGQTITSNISDWGHDTGRAMADMNGDGRADYCRVVGSVNGQSSNVACTLSTGAGFGQTIMSPVIDWGYDTGRAWTDVNGDGKADYCRRVGFANNQSVACTLSTGVGFGQTILSGVLDWGYDAGRAWVDMNGDGRADYCRVVGSVNGQSSNVACTLSTGAGFGQTIMSPVIDWGYDTGREWRDVNGDGKADYCRRVGFANNQSVACTLSTGVGFGQTITSNISDWGHDTGRAMADMNGDGRADYCRVVGGANNQSSYITCNPIVLESNGVKNFTDGLGAAVSITYKPLTDSSTYSKDGNSTYPTLDIQVPLYVVQSVASDNGIGGTLTTNYTYGGLKADLDGRGLLGFRWMQSRQAESLITSYAEYRQDWPYVGMPSLIKKTRVYFGEGGGGLLSKVSNNHVCINTADGSACTAGVGKRYFPYVKTSTQSGWDMDGAGLPTVTTTNTYDMWGNATNVAVSTSDGFSKTTANKYFPPDMANWFLGRLDRSVMTSTTP